VIIKRELTDIPISGVSNAMKKAAEILKYQDLTTGIQCMWNATSVITVITKGNCNSLKIVQKITRKVSHEGTTSLRGTVCLAVTMASGTQDCGFEPGRSRQIFRVKKSTACLPSEGK
jgi:hypothetical protein